MRKEKTEYALAHKPEKASYDFRYRSDNKERIANYKKSWENRNKDNPLFKIKKNLRRRLHHVLKGKLKTSSTFALVGCSPSEFKCHIEKQFIPGMNWDNYGRTGWHIDHIKPCYSFDLLDTTQQKECFHYSNQRPLWAKDNLSRKRPK